MSVNTNHSVAIITSSRARAGKAGKRSAVRLAEDYLENIAVGDAALLNLVHRARRWLLAAEDAKCVSGSHARVPLSATDVRRACAVRRRPVVRHDPLHFPEKKILSSGGV